MKNEKIFNIYEELSKLSDVRRNQGKRHKIEFVIIIVILSIMSGQNGYRATNVIKLRTPSLSINIRELFGR